MSCSTLSKAMYITHFGAWARRAAFRLMHIPLTCRGGRGVEEDDGKMINWIWETIELVAVPRSVFVNINYRLESSSCLLPACSSADTERSDRSKWCSGRWFVSFCAVLELNSAASVASSSACHQSLCSNTEKWSNETAWGVRYRIYF